MTAYDEPTGRRHTIAQRTKDPRVFIMRCGLRIALIGHPKDRPGKLKACC